MCVYLCHYKQYHFVLAAMLLMIKCPMLLQRAQGITPDLHTYTSLLSGCGFARDPTTAHDLVSFCSFCALNLMPSVQAVCLQTTHM